MAMNSNGRWTTAEREAGLRELTESAHGAFTASVIGRGALPDVIGAAMRGDARAQRALHAIEEWLKSRAELGPGEQHQCLLCRREFVSEMPVAFAVASPFASHGPHALLGGICGGCAATTDDLLAAAVREWRVIWPDLRPIEGGRA